MTETLKQGIEARLSAAQAALPALPAIVRYYDDFEEVTRSVRCLDRCETVTLILDGRPCSFDFSAFAPVSRLLKHVWCDWIENFTPSTLPIAWAGLLRYANTSGIERLQELIGLDTVQLESHWDTKVLPEIDYGTASSLRAVMHSLCRLGVGSWQPLDAPRIRNLASPKRDKFRVIRLGDCFISPADQAKVVDYLEDVATVAKSSPLEISTDELKNAGLLVMCFENGLRPGQMARMKATGVRFFDNGSVHISFPQRKQRAGSPVVLITRRIGKRFTSIFEELHRRRACSSFEPNTQTPVALLFRMTPSEVSARVRLKTIELGIGPRSVTDFRHTAAQRLADSGGSSAKISEFLSHASTKIGSVYFRSSPTQAKIVNEALAVSEIYSAVIQAHKTKTIDRKALLRLPADNQIGGVPHGTPIAGIGGCLKGQSMCGRTPVLACYNCSRFIPLSELEIHERVLEQLRIIVGDFVTASRGETGSPAYIQLQATVEAVRVLIEELKQRAEP